MIRGDKAFAMKIEREIKKLTRAEKEALIAEPERLCKNSRVSLAIVF
jgi:predicted GIY-YIG superfamily endonuclease